MGRFVTRKIEKIYHWSWEGPVYYVDGPRPFPRLIVDDIEKCIYTHAAEEKGKQVYFREDF